MKVDYVFFFLRESRTDSAPILAQCESTALRSVATTGDCRPGSKPTNLSVFPIIGGRLGTVGLLICGVQMGINLIPT
jgi:hypothetical protein